VRSVLAVTEFVAGEADVEVVVVVDHDGDADGVPDYVDGR
jgi:hypothetical protein